MRSRLVEAFRKMVSACETFGSDSVLRSSFDFQAAKPDADSDLADTTCAVGLFADTFSLPCQRRCRPIVLNAPATPITMKATYFPAEVLLIIFKLVHNEERLRGDADIFWSSKDDNLSPSLFPYAIVAVCSYWRHYGARSRILDSHRHSR